MPMAYNNRCILVLCMSMASLSCCNASLDIFYMDTLCGTTVDLTGIESGSVETSRTLTYPNNMNCAVKFTAPAGKQLYMKIKRFVTEQSGNDCYDYLTIYDGEQGSNTIANELCGELNGEPEYNTNGDSVTFHFISDESAKDRGFAIYLLAVRPGPSCSSSELLCKGENICIDEETTVCDDYEHCNDGTDEASCTDSGKVDNGAATVSIGMVVGLALASLTVLIVIGVLCRLAYKKYKWNQYLKTLYTNTKLAASTKLEGTYPLTHNYQDDEFINVDRAQRDAAMVKIDDAARGEEEDKMPYGSSASLASTATHGSTGMVTSAQLPPIENLRDATQPSSYLNNDSVAENSSTDADLENCVADKEAADVERGDLADNEK